MKFKLLFLALFFSFFSYNSFCMEGSEKAKVDWKPARIIFQLGLVDKPSIESVSKAYDKCGDLIEEQMTFVEWAKLFVNTLKKCSSIDWDEFSTYIKVPESLEEMALVIQNKDLFKKRIGEFTSDDLVQLKVILVNSNGELEKLVKSALESYSLNHKFSSSLPVLIRQAKKLVNSEVYNKIYDKEPDAMPYSIMVCLAILMTGFYEEISLFQKELMQDGLDKYEILSKTIKKTINEHRDFLENIEQVLEVYEESKKDIYNFYIDLSREHLKKINPKYNDGALEEIVRELQESYSQKETHIQESVLEKFTSILDLYEEASLKPNKTKKAKTKKKNKGKEELERFISETDLVSLLNSNALDASCITKNDKGIVTIDDPNNDIEIQLVLPEPDQKIDEQRILKALDYHERVLGWFQNPKQQLFDREQLHQKKEIDPRKTIYCHAFSKLVDPFIIEYGQDSDFEDNKGQKIPNKTLVGQILDKMTGEKMIGVFGYGRIPDTETWYHRFFTQKTPEHVNQEYIQKGTWELEFPALEK